MSQMLLVPACTPLRIYKKEKKIQTYSILCTAQSSSRHINDEKYTRRFSPLPFFVSLTIQYYLRTLQDWTLPSDGGRLAVIFSWDSSENLWIMRYFTSQVYHFRECKKFGQMQRKIPQCFFLPDVWYALYVQENWWCMWFCVYCNLSVVSHLKLSWVAESGIYHFWPSACAGTYFF